MLQRLPYITLAVALLAAGTMMVPAAGQLLEFNRDALANGQLWRTATCHLTHFSRDHFGWCLLAMLVLGAACEMIHRRLFLAVLVASTLLIPIALFVFSPGLHTYRGLSGVDSALFALLLLEILRQRAKERHWIALAAAVGLGIAFLAKIVLEMQFGVTFFVNNFSRQFNPVPLAHLVGIVSVAITVLLSTVRCNERPDRHQAR